MTKSNTSNCCLRPACLLLSLAIGKVGNLGLGIRSFIPTFLPLLQDLSFTSSVHCCLAISFLNLIKLRLDRWQNI